LVVDKSIGDEIFDISGRSATNWARDGLFVSRDGMGGFSSTDSVRFLREVKALTRDMVTMGRLIDVTQRRGNENKSSAI
jgi:hypothetical protein